jgi:hypothetical protein
MPVVQLSLSKDDVSQSGESFDPFAALINKKLMLPSQKSTYIAVNRDLLVTLLQPHIQRIFVDETWYLDRSPDVRSAIDTGQGFISAADHYARAGYFEHRMPYLIEVDERWYLEAYSDVADAVTKGVFESGQAHFVEVGFREGRFPFSGFRLRRAAKD